MKESVGEQLYRQYDGVVAQTLAQTGDRRKDAWEEALTLEAASSNLPVEDLRRQVDNTGREHHLAIRACQS